MKRIRFDALVLMALGILGAAGTNAATFSWSQVQLTGATGLPAEAKRTYTFQGIVEGLGTKTTIDYTFQLDLPPVQQSSTTSHPVFATIWVDGKGSWDEQTKEAKESLRLEGDMSGQFVSRLKCTQDPWLGPSSCAVITAQMEVTKGPNYDWPGMVKKAKLPLSSKVVGPALAAAAAKKIAASVGASASSPPPAPKTASSSLGQQAAVKPSPAGAIGVVGAGSGQPVPHATESRQAFSSMQRSGTPDWNAASGSAAPSRAAPTTATARVSAAPVANSAKVERELASVSCARAGADGSRFSCTTRAGFARCEALRVQRQVDQCNLSERQ